MRASRTLRTTGLVALAAGSLLLSACSGTSSASGDAATFEVESETGTVSLPVEPKAALGFYTTDVDMLITLGYPLASEQPIRGDSGYTTFPSYFDQAALEGVTPFANFPEFNYEKVLDAEPDFILNGLGYDEEIGETLSDIAPTYTYNGFDGRDWREIFKETATNLDRVEQYDAWLASYQARVDELKAEIEATGTDPVVASLSYYEGELGTSCSYGLMCGVYEDLGLSIAPIAEGDGVTLSLEQIDQLQGIDLVFESAATDLVSDAKSATELTSTTAWQNLSFVQTDSIANYEMDIVYGSPSGQLTFLELVAAAVLDYAAKTGR
ncbi:ABC transporter substrate-binding protein [Microbacteriaceae bacterium VKM Ac-2854]|nr:ABC transporter substrate-binding protein [Microbacteriaceae bacterium VKM Ac-2854]